MMGCFIISFNLRDIIKRAHQAAREAERHPDWLRKCHKISDIDFLLAIFVRASICVNSGLHFLQKFKQIFGHDIACSSWFDANSSDRRARMVMAVMPFVNKILQDELLSQEVNHLGDFAVLNDFDCVAYDGHFMKRASQIKNAPGSKNKANAGYIFGIDLKTGILEPITVVSDGSKKQSEIPYFKEFCNDQELSSRLRKKRITVYDRAMASAGFLADEQGKEHYIITRSKKNSTWNKVESLDWDKDDPANINIIKDLALHGNASYQAEIRFTIRKVGKSKIFR